MSVEVLIARAAEAEANLDLPRALNTYEEALKLAPDSLEIAARLGSLASRLNMWTMAEKLYAHLITQGVHETPIVTAYAAAFREQARFDEAVDVLKTVVNQRPEDSALWEGLGSVMAAKGDIENAVVFFNEALRLEPDNLHARFNRGCALFDRRDPAWRDDLEFCASAFDDPDNLASAQIAYAQALLATGDLESGWKAYDGRERYGTARQVHYSLWSRRWREGQPLTGRHLMVSGEQGLGDEVLFASLLPDLIRDLGSEGSLTIGVEPRLVPLFQRSFPEANVLAHRTQTLEGVLQRSFPDLPMGDTDGWALMGDFLPLYRKQVSDFPKENSYLKPDPERVDYWRDQLAAIDGQPKAGILWKSLKAGAQRDRYFTPFGEWRELLTLEGVTFINLQYGDSGEEMAQAAAEGLNIHTLPGIDLKNDLDDLAALCAALDVVLAPSNATSNISAACGVPTWLLATGGSWLQLGQVNYPWYPSAQVFTGIADMRSALTGHFKP